MITPPIKGHEKFLYDFVIEFGTLETDELAQLTGLSHTRVAILCDGMCEKNLLKKH